MAPGPPPPGMPSMEEYAKFMDDVAEYHQKRGTPFDREPKVSGRPVNLLSLYDTVMQHGGYDVVSAERMQWRELAKSFGLGTHHEAAMAFQLKSVYYKYLAAYEISNYWHEIPPPPEILEQRTAKGGDLRHRTLENYQVHGPREATNLEDARDSGEDDQRTPKTEAVDGDDQTGAGRYPSRLRQDPKKVQMFQPDTTPARMSRNATHTHSPQPSPIPGQPLGMPMEHKAPIPSVTNYVPQQPMPLTLRQVITPGNNPDVFRQRMAMAKAQKLPKPQIQPQQLLRGTLPPSQLSGPNIYIRCLYGLRSGIQEQQDFALHHLVKVSYERGDKYKFEGFPLLAESLIEKALGITELLYDTTWDLSYADQSSQPNVLNGSFGTPNLMERIEQSKVQAKPQGVESAEFQHKLHKVTEAIVVIRNMCWLDDNANFISMFPYFREFLVIALNLPKVADISEYEHCALKICEDVTPFLSMTTNDPLLLSLLRFVESDDRGAILSALKAIDYISGELPIAHKLIGLSPGIVERICHLTTLPDEELQLRALKILYQYTSHPENLREIFSWSTSLIEQMVPRLVDSLMYDARHVESRQLKKPAIKQPPNTVIPTIPPELLVQLIQIQESDRSKYWLRSCFEEDGESDITQIAIWQAYQAQFSQHNPLAASEFIKNVSSTFSTAQAQVINGPQPRFIIKGIRPRRTPIDLNGNQLQKCLWEIPSIDPTQPDRRPCGTYHLNRQGLWTHILNSHLHFQRDEDQKFLFAQAPPEGYKCCWPHCHKHPLSNTRSIAAHIKIHLPDDASLKSSSTSLVRQTTQNTPPHSKTESSDDIIQEATFSTTMYFDAPIDMETGHVYGIPAVSMRILQNIARNVNKLAAQEKASASMPGGVGLGMEEEKSFLGMVDRLFPQSIKLQLAHVFAHNRTVGPGVLGLMSLIEKGESGYRALNDDEDRHGEGDEAGIF